MLPQTSTTRQFEPSVPRGFRSSAVVLGLSVALGFTSCISAAGGDAGTAPAGVPEVLVLGNGARLAGTHTAKNIRIEEGTEVLVTDDLELVATDFLLIEGELRAVDVELDSGTTDGHKIVLVSEGKLAIRGRVVGGRGRTFAGLSADSTAGRVGGAGSSIVLSAPLIDLTGSVYGGPGGQGGGGSAGGAGGSVASVGSISGSDPASREGTEPAMVGGEGGSGGSELAGYEAGTDGVPGDVLSVAWPEPK